MYNSKLFTITILSNALQLQLHVLAGGLVSLMYQLFSRCRVTPARPLEPTRATLHSDFANVKYAQRKICEREIECNFPAKGRTTVTGSVISASAVKSEARDQVRLLKTGDGCSPPRLGWPALA